MVYKDFTVDHFDDFEHFIAMKMLSNTGAGICWGLFLSNLIQDSYNSRTVGNRFIGIFGYHTGASYRISLCQWNGVAITTDDYLCAGATWYYFKFKRVGTALTLEIYTDEARTIPNRVAILSVTSSTDALRYLYGLNSRDDNRNDLKIAIEVKDLDIQEGGGPPPSGGYLNCNSKYINGG